MQEWETQEKKNEKEVKKMTEGKEMWKEERKKRMRYSQKTLEKRMVEMKEWGRESERRREVRQNILNIEDHAVHCGLNPSSKVKTAQLAIMHSCH
jgi:hypothetical protein